MISKKRGKLVIVLCLLLVLFSSLIYAAENGCYTYPEAKAGVTYCVPNLNKQEASSAPSYKPVKPIKFFQ